MPYPFASYERNEPHTKRNVADSQEQFRHFVAPLNIGERLLRAFKEAYGTADVKFIAEKLGYESHQAVYKVIKGKGELNFDRLRKFSSATKRSIDWLLLGEEAQEQENAPASNPYDLTPEQLLFINMLAEKQAEVKGKKEASREEVNAVIREIVFAGLDAKARELSLTYRAMGRDQLEDVLNAVLAASPREGDDGAEDEARAPSLGRHARARR